MEYVGILDVPPLRFVLLSVVQTFTLFVAVLLGSRLLVGVCSERKAHRIS